MTFRKRILSAVMCLCLLYTAVPLRAKAAAAGSTQADERLSSASITAWKTGATSFNINGRNSSGEYQTTYRDRGYQTVACVDGGTKQKNPSNLIAAGLRLDVDIETENDNYIKVRYTLTNSGVGSHTVNVGSHADVMIDNNDKVPIWAEVPGGNTLNMSGSPKNDYAFKLVATSCDTLWYGIFYESYRNCFTDMTDRGSENMFTKDSGLAYSWNATVAPGEIWTRCVLIGTGSNNEMAIEAPVIPEPEVVIPDPSIELVSNEVYYTEEETLPEQAKWRSLRFVKSYKGNLTVTGIPSDSNTIGVYTVTYKAENSKGTATAELKVNILPKPAALSQAAVTGTGNFTLSAKMEYTGGLNYTETGFVYGVISKPTLAKNDGTVKTSKAVGSKGGALSASVAKSSLAVGLQYYARAYAKASDGSVIYGASSAAFGVGVPAYGTFSVKNNKNNTFTISRTGGTEGKQTVYYRTVNGSAVGGTHFNHTYGTVTFAAGSSANQTVTVTEYGVDKVYKSWGGTAYSNADRTYQLEIYRVEGGAAVKTVKATRTMAKNSSYSIDRNIYGTEKSIVNIKKTNSGKNGERIADAKKAQGATNTNVNFMLNRYGAANYNTSTSLSDYYSGNILSYIKSTCSQWLYRYEMYAYEEEDGWEHAYIGTKQLENAFYEVGSGDAVSLINGQLWACTFQQGQGDNQNLYKFPSTKSGGGENSRIPTNWNGAGNLAAPILTNNHRQSDSYYVRPGVNDNCYLHFSASGGGEATCTEKDYNAYDTCSRCDYTTFEETAYGDHDYENGTWVTDENGHRKKCANCDSTDAPADHIFGEWADGKRTCEVCGYEERQIISVTITWSEMSFTYTDGVWDPETHDCPIGEWKADSTDGNMLTVENGGEGEVTVSFVYTQEDDSVAGSFADEQGADIETPVALPAGNKKYAWLNLNGKPKRDMNAETVGRVTVYLGGNK